MGIRREFWSRHLTLSQMCAGAVASPGAVGQIARLWPLVCARKSTHVIYTCNDSSQAVLSSQHPWVSLALHPLGHNIIYLASCLPPGCCSSMEQGDNKPSAPLTTEAGIPRYSLGEWKQWKTRRLQLPLSHEAVLKMSGRWWLQDFKD